jgi:hypothetical protein
MRRQNYSRVSPFAGMRCPIGARDCWRVKFFALQGRGIVDGNQCFRLVSSPFSRCAAALFKLFNFAVFLKWLSLKEFFGLFQDIILSQFKILKTHAPVPPL